MTTFHIVPAGLKGILLIVLPVSLLMLAVLLLMLVILRSSQSATFELTPRGLHLHGEPLYRSFVPASVLKADEARVVDLRAEPELRPKGRTFGTGMPGYGAGWFRLANGAKALVYLTDQSRVVYIQTTDGFALMLSVTQPEQMLARLREVASQDSLPRQPELD
jgi:hypothetical protein